MQIAIHYLAQSLVTDPLAGAPCACVQFYQSELSKC
jgi:hypothetical protein